MFTAFAGTASAAATVDHQAWASSMTATTFTPKASRIYASVVAGSEESRAFVHLNLGGADPGTFADAELTLTEDGADSLLPDQALLAACSLAKPLTSSGQLATPIEPDCRQRASATRHPNGTWTLPLGVFASGPATALTYGFVLFPDSPSAPATWRISIDTSKSAVAGGSPAAVSTPAVGTTPAPATAEQTNPGTAPIGNALTPALETLAGPPAPQLPPQVYRTARPNPNVGAPPATALPGFRARSAATPSALAVFGLLAAIALMALGVVAWRQPRALRLLAPVGIGSRRALSSGMGLAALLALSALPDASLYKAGLVLIVLVAAIGLHVLVNWAGELSLAHAGFIGVPAFAVAKVAGDHHVSPVLLLPFGVIVGALTGVVVGLPALRAKGPQVALLTLAAGIAISSFFFTRPWLVGPAGGVDVPVPTLGPITFATTRSLYFLLLAVVCAAVGFAWMLYRSKLGRGLAWIRSRPTAASAFGVPVARYKLLAYGLAGAFAGLAGGLSVVWVQHLTPGAFPLSLSFTYLMIVVLAGRGFVGGVAVAAAGLEGSRLFISSAGPLIAYAGPAGLLLVLTRQRAGLNGIGAQIMSRFRTTGQAKVSVPTSERDADYAGGFILRPGAVAGAVLAVMGLVAIGLGSYHAGNTDQLWIQNQEIVSGGLGGLALVVLGVGLLIRDGLMRGQAELVDRLIHALREGNDEAHPVPVARASRGRLAAHGVNAGADGERSA